MIKLLPFFRIAFIMIVIVLFFSRVASCDAKKEIALTFDDGPNPAVLKNLLPLLARFNAPATFFVIGAVAQDHKEWLMREAREGHRIENHSFGHENFKKLAHAKGLTAIRQNVDRTNRVVQNATNRTTRFVRPPYWEITPEIERELRDDGYTIVKLEHPDINSLDYDDVAHHRSVATLIVRVQQLIASREHQQKFTHVLVFHELPLTVKALDILIPYFKNQGYTFVVLHHLYPFTSP